MAGHEGARCLAAVFALFGQVGGLTKRLKLPPRTGASMCYAFDFGSAASMGAPASPAAA
jgi:hypothetical protein